MRTLAVLVMMGCGSPVPETAVEVCDNRRDDDGDGWVDCGDADCLGQCAESCEDGQDDDGDGLVDCEDPDCDGRCAEICDDGRDNDGDGLTDCVDADCYGHCSEDCGNGRDDDADGLVDCMDPDCSEDRCIEHCDDGRDNDGDGLVDCDDPDCSHLQCAEICDDGRDNDADGRVDCADPDCEPACAEHCTDGEDNDGDRLVDCDDPECDFLCDADGDGYRSWVVGGDDCDDRDATIHPGRTEVCNAIDDDCDYDVDEDDPGLDGSTLRRWHRDADGDGYGSGAREDGVRACFMPEGFVADSSDCDDGDPRVHPSATEICDGRDNDCDALRDDADPSVDLATAPAWSLDADTDGYGSALETVVACRRPTLFYVPNSEDCDDDDPRIGPPTSWVPDGDGDGVGTGEPDGMLSCVAPAPGLAAYSRGQDCADDDPSVFPGAIEVCEDGLDQDCDGVDDACARLMYAATGGWSRDTDIWEIDTEGHRVRLLGSVEERITSMTFGPGGQLYVIGGSLASFGVGVLDLATGELTELFDPRLRQMAMTATPEHLYVADQTDHLYRYDWETLDRVDLGLPDLSGEGGGWDLATHPDGTVFYGNSESLWRLGPEDRMLPVARLTDLGTTRQGSGMTFHGGVLWLTGPGTEFGNRELYMIDPETGDAVGTGVIIPTGQVDALASPTP